MNAVDYYKNCMICPRECKVDRTAGEKGFCGQSDKIRIARAALHFWEEPCLSGSSKNRGSGTIFFSGCTMRCAYCQNREIASGEIGKEISVERLTEIFYELEEKGAYNINFVTPDCYLPSVAEAVSIAKGRGFKLPFVFNVSGYEKAQSIKNLEGLCDIYLVDYRYDNDKISSKYSLAPNYTVSAREAISEMVSQQPKCVFDSDGMMKNGVIVRLLMLPGHLRNSKNSLKYLYEKYGDNIIYSLMSQFTPTGKSGFPELERKVTDAEYDSFLSYALSLGIENAFAQDSEAAKESFIPDFNYEGVE